MYLYIIRQAIDRTRPADEQWTVMTHAEQNSTVITFDLARGTEAPRHLTYQPEDDDADYTLLFRLVSGFLKAMWPGANHD